MQRTYFRTASDCGCGGNGAWQPADAQADAAPNPNGLVGPMAPGYFSTWAGPEAATYGGDQVLPPAEPAPAE